MNPALRNTFILFLGILCATCQKGISVDTGTSPITPSVANITAQVQGRIVDEYGDPVKGAVVTAGTFSTTTNINGEFAFDNANLKSDAALVKVSKTGYFPASRTFRARQGNKHYVEIQLIPKILIGSISSSTGGTIGVANGSAITLPANGVVIASSGAAFSGNVKVEMAWIDPTSRTMFLQMPGDLRGIDASNSEQSMQSYGMLAVELTSDAGEKLQLATGKTASLKFPIPTSLSPTAPATIALWSFDESTGLWKQEGTASKTGNSYIAGVSHFSYWNCDVPIANAANFSATLVDQTGQPLRYVHAYITSAATGQYTGAHGMPDSSGYITGRVPAGEPLFLLVYSATCGTNILMKNIGPFQTGSNNNLGMITATSPGAFLKTIIGTALDCSGNPITNGFAEIKVWYATFRVNITAGNFSLSFSDCGGPTTVTYFVADNLTSKQSAAVTTPVNSANTNVGAATACGISTQQFINFNLDGNAYSLTNPPDSLTALVGVWGPLFFTGTGASNHLQFGVNAPGIGTFPLTSINIGGPTFTDSLRVSPVNPINVNITEFGTVGNFISGSYSGILAGTTSPTHTIQCNFRVRREY